jgi:hypothetical protein
MSATINEIAAIFQYLLKMRYFILLAFCLIKAEAMAQDSVLFTEEIEVDTSTTEAQPVGGYKQLLQFLAQNISAGDTIGQKTSIHSTQLGFILMKKAALILPTSVYLTRLVPSIN